MPLKLLIVKLIGNNITKHSKFNFTTIAPTRCKSEYDDPARATYSKSCLSDTFEFKFKQKVKKKAKFEPILFVTTNGEGINLRILIQFNEKNSRS